MAKARVGVVLDKAGIGLIMKSGELADVLASVAADVASAAGSGYEVTVEYDRRKSRVIAHVVDPSDRALGRDIATGNWARAVSSKESGWKK